MACEYDKKMRKRGRVNYTFYQAEENSKQLYEDLPLLRRHTEAKRQMQNTKHYVFNKNSFGIYNRPLVALSPQGREGCNGACRADLGLLRLSTGCSHVNGCLVRDRVKKEKSENRGEKEKGQRREGLPALLLSPVFPRLTSLADFSLVLPPTRDLLTGYGHL